LGEHHKNFAVDYHEWDPNQELDLGIRNSGYPGSSRNKDPEYPYSVEVTRVPSSQQAGMDLVDWDVAGKE